MTTFAETETPTQDNPTWVKLGFNIECDAKNGENYLRDSSEKLPSVEGCQKSCEDSGECQSISYLKNGWCNHYSTPCTNHIKSNKAISMRRNIPTNRGTWANVGSNIECDISAGEIYLEDSSGKVPSVGECKKLCEFKEECQSITYLKNGWCRHFSTVCTNHKRNTQAVSMRLDPPTTHRGKWTKLGHHIECDVSAGEKYIQDSPGKLPNLDQCKKLCEVKKECQSITYLKTGWCNHYSTPCTNHKSSTKAVSMRLDVPTWGVLGSKSECDQSAGEKYINDSPGKLPDIEKCKKSCADSAECWSITYTKSGWCLHFSTLCTNRKTNVRAVSISLETKPGATGKPTTATPRTTTTTTIKRKCVARFL